MYKITKIVSISSANNLNNENWKSIKIWMFKKLTRKKESYKEQYDTYNPCHFEQTFTPVLPIHRNSSFPSEILKLSMKKKCYLIFNENIDCSTYFYRTQRTVDCLLVRYLQLFCNKNPMHLQWSSSILHLR